MTITVSVPDQLAQQAQAAGVSIECYVERLLAREIQCREERTHPCALTPEQAVDDIRELRKGVTLGGLKIRDLINEGRKY
jgi:hypothetical protein